MSDVQVILNSFLRDELDFPELQRELSTALRDDPDSRWEALGMLRELRGANRISKRLHEILKTEIQAGMLEVMEDDTQIISEQGVGNGADGPTWTSKIQVELVQPNIEEKSEDDTRAMEARSHGAKRKAKASRPTVTTLPNKSHRPLGVGSVLKGRFVLESRLGRGGMGVVYKALDQRRKGASDHSPFVALKVLREDFKTHPDSLHALQRESHEAQRLSHPNIVNVFDFDRDGETYFMTMELLHGEPLSQLFLRQHPQPIPRDDAFRIIRGLGQGLMFAHEHNVVHLDFKPGNVFLTESGGVKILDFGIAQVTNPPGQTELTLGVSDSNSLNAMTPAYASCERLEGAGPDPRDDVYALGCVAYELLAGRHPFDKKSAVEARAEKLKPERIKDLTRKQWRALINALMLERSHRTLTVGHFLDELGVLPADVSPYLSADTGKRVDTRPVKVRRGTPRTVGFAVILFLLASAAYVGQDEIRAMIRGDWTMQRLVPGLAQSDDPVPVQSADPEQGLTVPPELEAPQEANSSSSAQDSEIEIVGELAPVGPDDQLTVQTIAEESLELTEEPDLPAQDTAAQPTRDPTTSVETPTQPVAGPAAVESPEELALPSDGAQDPIVVNGGDLGSVGEIMEDVVVDTTIAGTIETAAANAPGTFSFATDTITVGEDESAVYVPIVRADGDYGVATVSWATNSVTADADGDYGHFAGSVETFANEEKEKTIFIPLVSDSDPESNESFFVSLYAPSDGAKLGLTTQVLVTIIDDDR